MNFRWKPAKHDYFVEVVAATERLQARGVYPTTEAVSAMIGGGTRYRIGQVLRALVERGDIVIRVPKPKTGRPSRKDAY